MKSAARSEADRPSKRDVITIDDEESTNDQPVVKSAKRDDEPPLAAVAARPALPPPVAESTFTALDTWGVVKKEETDLSINVVELQQELLRSKDNYERACYAAREAETRAELAEKLLETKRAVDDKFNGIVKQKVAELEKKLADALKKVEVAERREDRTYGYNRELARENEALKNEMAQMRKEHNSRIEELTLRLDQYEGGLEVLKKLKQQRPDDAQRIGVHAAAAPAASPAAISNFSAAPAADPAAGVPPFHDGSYLHHIGHPTNLFQLCHPYSSDAMLLDEASIVLADVIETDRELFRSLGYIETDVNHECCMCQKFLRTNSVVPHFLSESHQNQVACARAAVSRHAVAYWVGKLTAQRRVRLQFEDAAVERPMQHVPAAADAAATRSTQQSPAAAASSRPEYHVPAEYAAATLPMQPPPAADAAAASPMPLAPPSAISNARLLELLKPFHTLPDTLPDTSRTHHPTNIFQLCRPGSIQSVSVLGARDLLIRAVEKAGNNGKTEFNRLYSEMHAKESWLRSASGPCSRCDACEIMFFDAYKHFISEEHCNKVLNRDSAVSWTALSYWNRRMQQLQQQQLPAAEQRPDIDRADVAD